MTQTNIEQDRIDFETIKTLTLKPYLTLMMNLGGAGNYDDLDKFKRDSFWEKTHEKAAEAIAELCIGLASQINISNKLREELSNNQAAVKLQQECQASGEAVVWKISGNLGSRFYTNYDKAVKWQALEGIRVKIDLTPLYATPQQSNIPANLDELIYEHTRFNVNQANDLITIKGIKSLINAVLSAA